MTTREEWLQKLLSGEKNMAGADLTDQLIQNYLSPPGVDLSNSTLTGVEFDSSALDQANLSGANAGGAYFSNVDLNGANFSSAFLHSAQFRPGNYADLTGVNLSGANARNASFSKMKMIAVNLSGASVRYADFTSTDLRDATFTGAILTDAVADGSTVGIDPVWWAAMGGIVKNAARIGALESVTGGQKKLSGIDLHGATLRDLAGQMDLSGVDLTDANLCRVDFPGVNFSNANLSNANLAMANLSGANLSGADLSSANLYGANLHGAVLQNTKFLNADLTNIVYSCDPDAPGGMLQLNGSSIFEDAIGIAPGLWRALGGYVHPVRWEYYPFPVNAPGDLEDAINESEFISTVAMDRTYAILRRRKY